MLMAVLNDNGMAAQQNTARVIVLPTLAIAMSSQTKSEFLRYPR